MGLTPPVEERIILDLCGGTGSWSQPYRNAGYAVLVVDPKSSGQTVEELVTMLRTADEIMPVWGVLAAPPCTAFSGSGAQHWPSKDASGETFRYVLVARACVEVVEIVKPKWWALENPVGRMTKLVPEVGPVRLTFDPNDYGDPYTKRTQLFGKFTLPEKHWVPPIMGSAIHREGPSAHRQAIRSVTPPGFAKAFFDANP